MSSFASAINLPALPTELAAALSSTFRTMDQQARRSVASTIGELKLAVGSLLEEGTFDRAVKASNTAMVAFGAFYDLTLLRGEASPAYINHLREIITPAVDFLQSGQIADTRPLDKLSRQLDKLEVLENEGIEGFDQYLQQQIETLPPAA